jgi:hypothetical protein
MFLGVVTSMEANTKFDVLTVEMIRQDVRN